MARHIPIANLTNTIALSHITPYTVMMDNFYAMYATVLNGLFKKRHAVRSVAHISRQNSSIFKKQKSYC